MLRPLIIFSICKTENFIYILKKTINFRLNKNTKNCYIKLASMRKQFQNVIQIDKDLKVLFVFKIAIVLLMKLSE